jgi:hypothetical protein
MPLAPRLTRTRIDPSYGITGDAKGASWPAAEEKLAASRNYWVCTTRPNGAPHSKPVWGVWVDGALWFGTGGNSVTGRNITHDPRVSIHLESGDDTVIMEGIIETLPSAGVPAEVKSASNRKYEMPEDGEEPEGAVWYRFAPRMVLTWIEQDYPATAARWEFD